MIAALPMYDWPEVAAATDGLWARLRDGLRAEGVPAPLRLDRSRAYDAAWTDPGLVLGQTCGLPYVAGLRGRVALVGAFDFGLPGCAPGWYRSAVVVRKADPRLALTEFEGARLAVNGRDSQSGYGAILHHAPGLSGAVVVSGAHRRSVRMVAEGAADLAAIDYVSWRLARRFVPEATGVRVLMLTDPTPGQPLIASPGADVAAYRRALAGIVAPDLGVVGFAALEDAAYDLIAARVAAVGVGVPG